MAANYHIREEVGRSLLQVDFRLMPDGVDIGHIPRYGVITPHSPSTIPSRNLDSIIGLWDSLLDRKSGLQLIGGDELYRVTEIGFERDRQA